MIVVVTGIPGVGKTTVVSAAIEGVKKTGVSYTLVIYGTVMFEEAKKIGVKSRDEMRELDLKVQKKIQKKAAEIISKIENVVVDTHCSVKTKKGYMPGLPKWVLESLNPDVFVLIEASEKEIKGRRENDETRNRDDESIEEIKFHQEINRSFAASYAAYSGCSVATVTNSDGKVDEASEAFKKILEV